MTGRGSEGTELLARHHTKPGWVLTRLIGSRTACQERGNDSEREGTHTSKLRCKFAARYKSRSLRYARTKQGLRYARCKSRSLARARSARVARDDMLGALLEKGEGGEQSPRAGVHFRGADVLFPAANRQITPDRRAHLRDD